jgi:hypothetical protein
LGNKIIRSDKVHLCLAASESSLNLRHWKKPSRRNGGGLVSKSDSNWPATEANSAQARPFFIFAVIWWVGFPWQSYSHNGCLMVDGAARAVPDRPAAAR